MRYSEYQSHAEHPNPMADEDEKESPLKKYQYLLPPASRSINSLDQHLFLGKKAKFISEFCMIHGVLMVVVNVSILFPAQDAMNLRFTVARTVDRATNPANGETEQRALFQAALVVIQTPAGTGDTIEARSTQVLARGPTVPYFAPPPEAIKAGNYQGKVNFSSSSARHVSEESEVRDAKEKAMSLLMARVESMVHAEISGPGEQVEIWESKTWKHVESGRKEESIKSSKRGNATGSGWFSKV
jgi:hypothetical protein